MDIIYLDNCSFNRPFDDQTYTKIHLETIAKLRIQQQIIKGKYKLAWSPILEYENSKNPYLIRRENIQKWKDIAYISAKGSEAVKQKMKEYISIGFKPKDALHLAFAVNMNVDYFITTDQGILKKNIIEIKVRNPIDFISEKGD